MSKLATFCAPRRPGGHQLAVFTGHARRGRTLGAASPSSSHPRSLGSLGKLMHSCRARAEGVRCGAEGCSVSRKFGMLMRRHLVLESTVEECRQGVVSEGGKAASRAGGVSTAASEAREPLRAI